jgi:hypothetical protein
MFAEEEPSERISSVIPLYIDETSRIGVFEIFLIPPSMRSPSNDVGVSPLGVPFRNPGSQNMTSFQRSIDDMVVRLCGRGTPLQCFCDHWLSFDVTRRGC